MGSLFEIRPSNDLTQFYFVGEKATGERVFDIYDGATGNLVKSEDIDEKNDDDSNQDDV